MIFSYASLAKTLREKCDKATHRIWICAPFIGKKKDVLRIIGGSWKRSDIDFRIITDIETGFIRQDTFDEFINYHPNAIRSLKSLHAKVFIVDNWCLITSANLTATAFSKRYEIGTDDVNIEEMESFYLSHWHNKKSRQIVSWKPGKKQTQIEFEEGNMGYDKLTDLPSYSARTDKIDKYHAQCSLYHDFAETYEKITGRCQDMVADGFTLLQEVDYLFNYLEHVAKVSNELSQAKPRKETEQHKLLKKYFREICQHYKQNRNHEIRRVNNANIVKRLTSPGKIMQLTRKEIRVVLDTFNCFGLGSNMHGHASRFIEENSIDDIRSHWNDLLNHGEITASKVEKCCELNRCGDSSVSELIAWRFPEKYPIMNTCSKKGLWFFGINI